MRHLQSLLALWLAVSCAIGAALPTLADETTAPAPSNFDLTSTERTIQSTGAGTIQADGNHVEVTPSSMLTPAEFLALQQVLQTGVQQLILGANGSAVGGTFALNPAITTATNVVIPTGVTATRDFGVSQLNITGNLINSGTMYAFSSNPQITTANISALNVINNQGANLSTMLPAGFLPDMSSLVNTLNLQLTAINNIVNAGSIYSSGNLNLTAGGTITNALPQGITGAQPIMQALGNMTFQAASLVNQGNIASVLGNINVIASTINNSGTIQALQGSMSIQNLLGNTLNINNTLGNLLAKNAITFNVIDNLGSLAPKPVLDIRDGNIAGSSVAFINRNGIVNVNANRITGPVDVQAGIAQVGTQQGALNIASMEITNDPIYYSHDPFGGLILSGINTTTGGGDFIALSAGDIVTTDIGATELNAGLFGGTGGKIVLAAGVSFTTVSGTSPDPCTNCTGQYSITGASAEGGSVLLPNAAFRTNGNSISVEAHAGTNSSGLVLVGLLDSSGAGGVCCTTGVGVPAPAGQSAGTISITADGTVTTGAIRAFGGGGAGGYATAANGGAGGNGNTVTIQSTGNVLINGEINTSGGGGGGLSASQTVGTHGGNAGNAGVINVNTQGTFISAGPLLAAGGGGGAGHNTPPCCPQIYRNAGGSFGGGGGGGESGAGGGGYYGGGGAYFSTSAGGGGFWGPGAGTGSPCCGIVGNNGAIGMGGSSIEPGTFNFPGGTFGVGGNNSNQVAQAGFSDDTAGGTAGANATINITAQSMTTQQNVGTFFGGLGSGFASSPFASTFTFGTVNFTPAGPPTPPTPSTPTTTTPPVTFVAPISVPIVETIIDTRFETAISTIDNSLGSMPTRLPTDLTPIDFNIPTEQPELPVLAETQVADGELPRIPISDCPPLWMKPDGTLTSSPPTGWFGDVPVWGTRTSVDDLLAGWRASRGYAPVDPLGGGLGGLGGFGGGGGGQFNQNNQAQLQAQFNADMNNLQAILDQGQRDAQQNAAQRAEIIANTQAQIFALTQRMTVGAAQAAEYASRAMQGWLNSLTDLPLMLSRSSSVSSASSHRDVFHPLADLEVPASDDFTMAPFPWIHTQIDLATMNMANLERWKKNPPKLRALNPLVDLEVPLTEAIGGSPFPWMPTMNCIVSMERHVSTHIASKRTDLPIGNAFFNLNKSATLQAHDATIRIAAKSKVVIMNQQSVLTIFNFCDEHLGAVAIGIGGKEFTIPPGQQVVLCNHQASSFDRVNPNPGISYRRLKKHDLNNGMTLFECDFSIPMAIRYVEPLRSMRVAKTPRDRHTMDDLMKMAAIIMQTKNYRGPYQSSPVATSHVPVRPHGDNTKIAQVESGEGK